MDPLLWSVGATSAAISLAGTASSWLSKVRGNRSSPNNGLMVLADTENPLVDICLIHGLNGHRLLTWTATDPTSGREVLWPEELLPGQVSDIRVLTYGYDSQAPGPQYLTQRTLYYHANHFWEDLSRFRESTNSSGRPIIFLAHNLGGIILKSALIFAHESARISFQNTASSTCGIIFFGTPHHESQSGISWARVVSKIAEATGTPRAVTRDVEKYAKTLEIRLDEYKAISAKFPSYNIYESLRTGSDIASPPYNPFVVSPCSLQIQIVPRTTLNPLPTPQGDELEFEKSIMLHKAHFDLTKFASAHDPEYQIIVSCIKRLCAGADQVIAKNNAKQKKAAEPRKVEPTKEFETPLHIPYPQNLEEFVGRHNILEQIHNLFTEESPSLSASKVVLHGHRGVGKTQIALQYVYSHRQDFSSIFWVKADTRRSIETSFVQIADLLLTYCGWSRWPMEYDIGQAVRSMGLQGTMEVGPMRKSLHSMVASVMEWFALKGNDNWLIVYDGIDNPSLLDLGCFFPPTSSKHGRIIVTSSRGDLLDDIQDVTFRHILVPPFSQQEAVHLFLERSGYSRTQLGEEGLKRVEHFVEVLERHPLTISMAATQLTRNNNDPTAMLGDMEMLRTSTIYTVQRLKISSRTILDISAMLSDDLVPIQLFTFAREKLGLSGEAQVHDAVMSLAEKEVVFYYRERCFIANRNACNFDLEILSHSEQMSSAEKACTAVSTAVRVSGTEITDFYQRVVFEQQLVPHAIACLKWVDLLTDRSIDTGTWKLLGELCERHGHLQKAEEFYKLVLGKTKVSHSENGLRRQIQLRLASVYHQQAKIHQDQEEYAKAQMAYGEVLESARRSDGTESGTQIEIQQQIASLEADVSDWPAAIKAYSEVINMQERSTSFGPRHPSTMASLVGLSTSLVKEGFYARAEDIMRRVVLCYQEVYGYSHPDTLQNIDLLALICQKEGKLSDAESHLIRLSEVKHTILGPDATETLRTMARLAIIYDLQGRYSDSETLYERASQGMARTLGEAHPDVLKVRENFALSYRLQGRLSDAQTIYKDVLNKKQGCKDLYTYSDIEHTTAQLDEINMIYS